MLRGVDFYGLRAVEFSFGDYTALVVPGQGANLVRLAHTGLGAEILRTPAADEIETFLRRPQVFGMPLLFPPNRIGDGRYRFDGREYRFPITIERENNYHHGILKSQPFVVSKAWEHDDEVLVECRYYSNAGNSSAVTAMQGRSFIMKNMGNSCCIVGITRSIKSRDTAMKLPEKSSERSPCCTICSGRMMQSIPSRIS